MDSKSAVTVYWIRKTAAKHWAFKIELLLIFSLSPFILFPGDLIPLSVHPYLCILLLVSSSVHRLWNWQWFAQTPLHMAITVILFWLPVNLWTSIDPASSWIFIGYLLLGIAIYDAITGSTDWQQNLYIILCFFLLLEVGLSFIGPILISDQAVTFPLVRLLPSSLSFIHQRLTGSINPNVLAASLVIFIPLHVSILLDKAIWSRRILLLGTTMLLFVAMSVLLLTQSRGGILAVVLAIGIVILLHKRALIRLVPLVVIGFTGVFMWLGPTQVSTILFSNMTIGGVDERFEIWDRALIAIHDFPFTGIGIGTFDRVIPLLYPYFRLAAHHEIPHAHNLLLQITIDIGLPGLIAYLAIVINTFTMLIGTLRQTHCTQLRSLAIGTLGSLIAMLSHGFFDAATWGNKLAFLPWLLFTQATLLFLYAQSVTLQPFPSLSNSHSERISRIDKLETLPE